MHTEVTENIIFNLDAEDDEKMEEMEENEPEVMKDRFQMIASEPFSLYGGSYNLSESQKDTLNRDRVYRYYELRMSEKDD